MKLKIFSACCALVLGTSAHAADATVDTYVPYDWSGVYVGAQAGGAWGKADDGAESVNLSGGAIGAYVGANWQAGNWVFGLEGDVNYTNSDGNYMPGVETGVEWQGALRGRLGYAVDRVLLYGTAGLAITQAYIDAPPILDEKETLTGWTVGAGVEYAITRNWTTRIDYRYSDYGGTDFGFGASEVDFTEHAVRIGVGYKF